jgi:site-specific DNA-methyltransferase (adenine-specific)
VTDEWLQPATLEMYRVLKKDALMVSFYGWNRVDRFMAAWKAAGFYAVGQLVFTKTYASNRRNAKDRRGFVDYCHEGAYVLAKGRPCRPLNRCRICCLSRIPVMPCIRRRNRWRRYSR